ncbi:MAG: globin family protein [Cyanobacteria bacterium P01_G01_bin.67]
MSLNIQLLETSFDQIKPHILDFSATFHHNLFTIYPELKPFFEKVDLAAQEKKLIASLAIIVENLRNPEELSLALKSLGAYHHELGTLQQHYPFVGHALIKTFATYLGSEWTLETETAWLDAYNFISETMLEGSKNPDQYLGGELTFYEWLDLYGESSSTVKEMIADTTHFKYRNSQAAHESI